MTVSLPRWLVLSQTVSQSVSLSLLLSHFLSLPLFVYMCLHLSVSLSLSLPPTVSLTLFLSLCLSLSLSLCLFYCLFFYLILSFSGITITPYTATALSKVELLALHKTDYDIFMKGIRSSERRYISSFPRSCTYYHKHDYILHFDLIL